MPVEQKDVIGWQCDDAKTRRYSGYKFPKQLKLLKSHEFRRVFADSSRQKGTYFYIHAKPNTLGYPRLGLVAARRQVPRAVDRQRVKRIIRESFRCHQWELPTVDVVVRVRPMAAKARSAELHQCLNKQWRYLIV